MVDCVPIVGIEAPQFATESLVDFLNDLINSGKQTLEEVLWPLFKGFCHDCMVGVADCVCDNVPCLVPAVSVVIKKNTHKLGDAESGVCVVDVDCHTISKIVQRFVGLEVTLDYALN